MNNGLFIICVCSYILSLVVALILMIAGKNANTIFVKRIVGLHFLSLLFFILVGLLQSFAQLSSVRIAATLLFLCSGIACSGLIWRTGYHVILKSYFLLFAASFILFVSAPSKLFSLLIYGNWQVKNYDRLLLYDNVYVDKQSSFLQEIKSNDYKVV